MSKLLKSLLGATAFLTLAATSVSAAPRQCFEVCDHYTSCCDDICAYRQGTGYVFTTCGEWGVCGGGCGAASSKPAAPVGTGEASQTDAQSRVCSEELQSAEQSATVES